MMTESGSQLNWLKLRGASRRRIITGTFIKFENSDSYHSISLSSLLREDNKLIDVLLRASEIIFPSLNWDGWDLYLVEGGANFIEFVGDEQTIYIDKRALSSPVTLTWSWWGELLSFILRRDYSHLLSPSEQIGIKTMAQLSWFLFESRERQLQILTDLNRYTEMGNKLTTFFVGFVSSKRRQFFSKRFPDLLFFRPPPSFFHLKDSFARSWGETTREVIFWQATLLLQDYFGLRFFDKDNAESLKIFRKTFSINFPIPWNWLCSPIPSIITEYYFRLPSDATSTQRRLLIFKTLLEHTLKRDEYYWGLDGGEWPLISLLILSRKRYEKLSLSLFQFIEEIKDGKFLHLRPVEGDDSRLNRLTTLHRLSADDERFFRQSAHIQVIWRDILFRPESQDWAGDLLLDFLEKLLSKIFTDPDILFYTVMVQRPYFINPVFYRYHFINNIKELLWIIAQTGGKVLQKIFPNDEFIGSERQERWPILRRYLRRLIHLGPPSLEPILFKIEATRPLPAQFQDRIPKYNIDFDSEISKQEVLGRIVPLLSRDELLRYLPDLKESELKTVKVVPLDRYLSKASGLWESDQFYRNYILFFKKLSDYNRGNWASIALWIDKTPDLQKLAKRKFIPIHPDVMAREEGIWEQTYRFQFLPVDLLMKKIKARQSDWENLFLLLGYEYSELLERRIREVLDFHYYTNFLSEKKTHLKEPGLFSLQPCHYEFIKGGLSKSIAEEIIKKFAEMNAADFRLWEYAQTHINFILKELTYFIRTPISQWRELAERTESNFTFQIFFKSLFSFQCSEFLYRKEHSNNPNKEGLEDKKRLVQILEKEDIDLAILFSRHLLSLFSRELNIANIYWELPSPQNSGTQNKAKREFFPFLQDREGNLYPLTFLYTLSYISHDTLSKTLEQFPSYILALQRAANLLRKVESDNEQFFKWWKAVANISRKYKSVTSHQTTQFRETRTSYYLSTKE